MTVRAVTPRSSSRQVSTRQAILYAWQLAGILDISAACLLAYAQSGRTPPAVLRGIASAIWGASAAAGGAGMAAVGLVMHFGVALVATLVFHALSRRLALLRTGSVWVIGPAYGAVVFGVMNFITLPVLSWARSLYLDTVPRWPGGMSWPQLAIHLVCVGLPIVWVLGKASDRLS